MLENSGIEIIITQKRYFDIINKICQKTEKSMTIVLIDEDEETLAWQQIGRIYTKKDINEMPGNDLECITSVSDLVYVLYTSGSTGKPKGVMMHHKAVANLMEWEIRRYGIGKGDKQIQFASLSFDVSFQEIFSSLLSGATLYLIEDEDKIPETIANMAEKEEITILSFPTSFFNQMAIYLSENAQKFTFNHLKYVFVAGEAMSGRSVKDWQSVFGTRHTIVNAYGPTEAHVVTYHDIDYKISNDVNVVTIGKPISNVQIYILDENNKLLGNGAIGELCIGGYNVARGYLNNSEKTNEVFLPDFIGNKGGKLYKTGDLARIGSDGNIEFLGRKDHQVKIRGFRVELGELENVISEYEKVDEVAVVIREDSNGTKRLVAFITSKEEVNIKELKEFVSSKVPSYMLPSVFMQLNEMPLTPNRKIDRLHLPSVKFADLIDNSTIIKPQTEMEIKVANIWCEVLKLESVGVNQDFFEIGGDSLLIMQVMAKLKAQYNKLDVKELFNNTTIQEICKVLEKHEKGAELQQKAAPLSKDNPIALENYTEEIVHKDYSNQEINKVFVTGTTGFLGGYITWQLLNNTDFRIYCLARENDKESAKERVYKNLEYLFEEKWTNSNYIERITVVNGNLGENFFGMGEEEYKKLASEVDAVYHAAANVKHYAEDESEFIKSNITATNNVIAFCNRHKVKALNYISTVGVSGLMNNREDKTFRETDFFEDAILPNIYEKTKYEAEKIVREYMFRGYPVRIFRTGFIMGDSTNGKFKKDIHADAMYRFIKAAIQMGVVPDSKNDLVEFSPVDFASNAIVMLSLNTKSIGKTLHICNPNPVSRNQLWGYIKDSGYNISITDSEWYKENVYSFRNDDEYMKGLQNIIVYLDDFYSTEIRYDSSIAQKYLSESELNCPRIDKNIIQTYVNYCIKVGYLQKPSDIDYTILEEKLGQLKK
ncbi:MAG: Linear gramicidin synthase subunit D [Firmicutes bacterium ADurb.Bin419]|nr:MAG: Linear gramicidin synthase subunit D [Firmicutes bacterium ADurb.Bin419]